jgi:hypothetical protein
MQEMAAGERSDADAKLAEYQAEGRQCNGSVSSAAAEGGCFVARYKSIRGISAVLDQARECSFCFLCIGYPQMEDYCHQAALVTANHASRYNTVARYSTVARGSCCSTLARNRFIGANATKVSRYGEGKNPV